MGNQAKQAFTQQKHMDKSVDKIVILTFHILKSIMKYHKHLKIWNDIMDREQHDFLALNFIKLDAFYRDFPNVKEVFDMAKDVLRAAPKSRTVSGDVILTTPAGSNVMLHSTALDRALQAIGITTHTSRFSHSNVLTDISNEAHREKGSLEEFFHQPVHDQVEIRIPNPSVLQGMIPR